jgi:hypothetical protein
VLAELRANPIFETFDPQDRPTEWTPEIDAAFEILVSAGVPVDEIGKMPAMPGAYKLWSWIADTEHLCSKAYARGKQKRVAKLEERIEQVAEKPLIGTITTERFVVVDGDVEPVTEVRSFDAIEHRRLLIDTLKWTLAHTRPKKHGRQPEVAADKANSQLESLFQSLGQGPARTDNVEDDE